MQGSQTEPSTPSVNIFSPIIRYFRRFSWNSNPISKGNPDYSMRNDLEFGSHELFNQNPEIQNEQATEEQLSSVVVSSPLTPAPTRQISTATVLSSYAKYVFAKENQLNLTAASLLTLLGSGLNYLAPYSLGVLIELLGKQDLKDEESNIIKNILIFTSIYTLAQLVPNFRNVIITTTSARTTEKMVTEVIQHQLNQTLAADKKTSPGDKIYKVQKAFMVANAGTPLLTNVVPIFLESGIAVAALTYQYGPPIGGGLAITLALYTAYSMLTTKPIVKAKEEMLETGNVAYKEIEHALNKYKVIHDFNKTDEVLEKIKEVVHRAADTEIKVGNLPLKIRVGHITISRLGMILAAVYAGLRVQRNQLTVPEFVALIGYLNQLCASMPDMGQALNQVLTSFGDVRFIAEKLQDSSNNIVDLYPETKLEVDNASASIRFQNVKFSYTQNTPILNNCSLEIKAGQTVALVSASGGGKSSIFNLLYGYFAPLSGEIFINEQNTALVSHNSLQENIALIQQEANLFMGSVRDNIKFGAKNSAEVTDETLFKLAQDLNLAGFICSLAKEKEINLASFSKGLDVPVGLDGSALSGGQQRKIAILRGFLKKAPIRLFDEITTGLDAESTSNVLAGIEKLTRDEGSTVIVITHQLREITSADTIFVLANGEVIAKGSHSELLESCEFYLNLWMKQSESQVEKETSNSISLTNHMGLFTRSNNQQNMRVNDNDTLSLAHKAPQLTKRSNSDNQN